MKGLKPLISWICAAAVLNFPAGCTIQPEANRLNLVFAADPKSTDPALATDVRTGQLCALLYDNLVHFSSEGSIEPAVARSWEISRQQTEYTFQLRTDVLFHDGSSLTADDVKWSFERILSPATKSHRTWLFSRVLGSDAFQSGLTSAVSGFQVRNDSTFAITLKQPFAPFLGFLAMPAASILKQNSEPVTGSGPWILEEWLHDGHLLFRRNENYFAGPPHLEQLRIRILPEALPRTAEFVTGYLDIMEVPEAEYTLWINDPEWQSRIIHNNELNIYYIGLNCERPPFSDKRMRQAVNYAVDVEKLITAVNSGKGTSAAGPIPPQLLSGLLPDPYGYDPEKARELITAAGYNDGVRVKLWQSQSPELLAITEAVQAQLAEVGIQTDIIRNDWNMFSQAVAQGKCDMYYRSWWADYPDPENFLAPLFESEISLKRWTRYSSPVLDSLIVRLQTTSDPLHRNQLAMAANQILLDDAPWIFLWHSQSATIIQPGLQNWQPSVMFNSEKYTDVIKTDWESR